MSNTIAPVFLPLHAEDDYNRNGLFPIVTHVGCANTAACVGYAKNVNHSHLFAESPAMLQVLRDIAAFWDNSDQTLSPYALITDSDECIRDVVRRIVNAVDSKP